MKTLTARSSDRSALSYFFSPTSIAVIGATDREGSVGGTVLKNLLTGTYKGRVYAVNPRRAEVFGLPCYGSIGAVPETVDLVVVVTPANTVPVIVSECVRADAKSVVVISAGFSAIVSTGSMLDVGWGDLLSFFGDDANTKSILLYMESIGVARSFLSAAREVSFSKPIIVIKAGRSEAASRAAASHTGAMTGSDEVYDAAFRRCGVLRVQSIAELFHMADVLGKQPRPADLG